MRGKMQATRTKRSIMIAALCLFPATSFPAISKAEAPAPSAVKSPVPLPKLKNTKTEAKNKEQAKPSQPEKPKGFGLKAELSPLNQTPLAKEEQKALSAAIKSLYKGKRADADKHKAVIKQRVAKKLLQWYALRSQSLPHTITELQQFLTDNPGWPNRTKLQAKIETAFLKEKQAPERVITHFKNSKPKTSAGKLALAQALLKEGKTDKAISLIKATYQNPNLPFWVEKIIVDRHKTHLSKEDHKIRADRLLYKFSRGKINAAMRAAKNLSKAEQEGAKFRAAVIRRQSGKARKQLAKLDKTIKQQPGVHLARIELARRSKKQSFAIKLIKANNFAKSDITDKDRWWRVRQKLARHAIENNQYQTAYDITSKHENPSVNLYKEAEFLSGWLALRFLKQPKVAEAHFAKFKAAADGPLSRSKSAYWHGRALKAQNKTKEAQTSFKAGAVQFNTFYGQLSARELGKPNTEIKIPTPPSISAEIAKRFVSRDAIQALMLAHQIDKPTIARLFFAHLRYHLNDPEELALLAELAASLGYNQSSIRIGKTAMAQNFLDLAHHSYPIRFMPKYKPLRSIPEQGLVYAIARQESEFNYQIKSRAGARGLLQVMPGTLKHVARKYNLKRKTAWLTQRPAFNAQIGSAYIGDRHQEFSGSYIMTFASFNAGPGRVRQWIRKLGDPRSAAIDPIDWIERIPFKETRKYVQKVTANLQVYRARLEGGQGHIQAYEDIYRGKFKNPAKAD